MATITASGAAAASPVKFSINRDIHIVREYNMAVGGAVSAGDVIHMMRVPAGAVLLDAVLGITGHDGVITASVGVAGADGAASLSSVIAQTVLSGAAGNITRLALGSQVGRVFTAQSTLQVHIAAQSAAGASGSLKLAVSYTMDNP